MHQITNNAGNAISAVTGANMNFALTVQFTDVDMTTGTDTLSITPITLVNPRVTNSDLQQGVTVGSSFNLVTVAFNMKILPANCASVKKICAVMVEGTGASYTDSDKTKSSNVFCIDIVARKSCVPGIVPLFD